MEPEAEFKARFVVCTVGGTPEPIVYCLNFHQPQGVLYVVSKETLHDVRDKIAPKLHPCPVWSDYVVVDPNKVNGVFEAAHQKLRERLARDEFLPSEALADITGGTKAMSAGLALAASLLGFRLGYVAGIRQDGGTGTVRTGTEYQINASNPLDLFAVRGIETANHLLAMGYPGSASKVLRDAAEECSERIRKRLERLAKLCDGLASIDLFAFGEARNNLQQPLKASDQPERLVGWEAYGALQSLLEHWERCSRIVSEDHGPQKSSMRPLMLELLANARRRSKRQEYDAAVACLYRAVEMYAQDLLHEAFGASRGSVEEDAIPEPAKDWLKERGVQPREGRYKVALANAFGLLQFAEKPEHRSKRSVYEDLKDVLELRNTSILAHGIRPLGEDDFVMMEERVWSALSIEEREVPLWPEIRLSLD